MSKLRRSTYLDKYKNELETLAPKAPIIGQTTQVEISPKLEAPLQPDYFPKNVFEETGGAVTVRRLREQQQRLMNIPVLDRTVQQDERIERIENRLIPAALRNQAFHEEEQP
jgi:hypothetical protein